MRIELSDESEIYLKSGKIDIVGHTDFSKSYGQNGKARLIIDCGLVSIEIEQMADDTIDAIVEASKPD